MCQGCHTGLLSVSPDQINNNGPMPFSLHYISWHFFSLISFNSSEINQGRAPTFNQILMFFFPPDKTEQMFPAAPDLDSEAGLILSAQESQLKKVRFGRLRSDSPAQTTAGSFLPQLSARIAVISGLKERRANAESQAAEFTSALRKHLHAQNDGGAGRCWTLLKLEAETECHKSGFLLSLKGF